MRKRAPVLGLLLALGVLTPAALQAQMSLAAAVRLALKNNPTVQAAAAGTDAVQQGIAVAQAGRYPSVGVSEGFTRGNNPVYVFGTLLTQRQFTAADFALGALNTPLPLNNFQTQLTASLPVYDAGQTAGKIRAARLQAQAARSQQARTTQEVIFQVVHAYAAELLAQASAGVAQAAVDAAQADLDNAQARQQQGMAVPSDLLSAQVQLANAREGLLSAHNAIELARGALNAALGLPETAPTQIEGRLEATSYDAGSLASQEQRALAARADLHAAQLQQQQSANGAAMARKGLLPRLSVYGSWARDSQTFASRSGNNWAVGATLSFNLFDGGGKFARIREANARERQADALARQYQAEVRLQVQQAYLNLETAQQRVTVERSAAAQAVEALRILQNRYQAGLATMTSVLQAEAARTQAQSSYLRAVYDYRLGFAALELATGELSPASAVVAQ